MSGGITYLLPLRWTDPGPIEELARYLASLKDSAAVDEIVVVDGSPSPHFKRHAGALAGIADRHLPPAPELVTPMGKVGGVITGVREASHEQIVIADDDVRYRPQELARVAGLLKQTDLVRPQNYFDELPWHARWDTARTLLNRVFTGDRHFPVGDFPGTLAVRRQSFLESDAYRGDVLFENLELMRTIAAWDGTVLTPLDLYVARRPPEVSHFFGQRVRQAYDDFAIPLRMAGFLSIVPLTLIAMIRRRWSSLAVAAAAIIALAEIGRIRAGGRAYFPVSASLLAPLWVAERAVCAWLALISRLQGGVRYAGGRLTRSASSVSALRRPRP